MIQFQTFPCNLPLGQRIVYFSSSIQQFLLEINQRFLLLRLGYLQVGYIISFIKERLHQRSQRSEQPFARINNTSTRTVGPSGRTAQGNLRIKGRAGLIGCIKCLCQLPFCLSHIRTLTEQLYRNSNRPFFWERKFQQLPPFNI